MVEPKRNMAASVRQRLKNLAEQRQLDFSVILVKYGLERLIYRMSISRHRDSFILKGGMLITVWAINDSRHTRDADFLGFGNVDEAHFKTIFNEILNIPADDGLVFDTAGLSAIAIRETQIYGGLRLKVIAHLDPIRIPLTIDIGFGDAITQANYRIEYPSLFDLPITNIRAYPPETVIAEKFQAIVALGIVNGRMKDYYDLWAIPRAMAIDTLALDAAISATFARRETQIPEVAPSGLTPDFFKNLAKVEQWRVYANSIDLSGVQLAQVVSDIWDYIEPSCKRLRQSKRGSNEK